MTNVHEDLNRLRKAIRLADVLDAMGVDATVALRLTAEQWTLFARLAGTPDPKPECREVVSELLAARERTRERIRQANTGQPIVAAMTHGLESEL